MNKTNKIKQLKNQIAKLQKELNVVESGTTKYKIQWMDKTYHTKHTTTVEAKTAAAAKRIFKNRKLNYVKYYVNWDGDQNGGPWKETVEYIIIRVTAVQTKAKKPSTKQQYAWDGRGYATVPYDGACGG